MRTHGLTARDLAERLRPRVTQHTVARWARGDRTPSPDHRVALRELAEIPEPAWATDAERRRAAWLKKHPVRPPLLKKPAAHPARGRA